MRALRSCDFCADDAVGAFEIVPPELEPTEAEQRRVVCCPDCRDRLETLLEPLLARAGAETDVDADAETNTADVEPDMTDAEALDATDEEPTVDESVLATVDDSTATRSRTAGSNATVSDGAASHSADSNADEAEPTRTEDESDAASSLEEGITFERDEHAPDEEPAADAEPAAGTETATAAETADAETVATDSTGATGTADAADADDQSESVSDSDDGDSTSASTRPPATYNKVIRLLRNREFPMERSDVEALAAGAYDLEAHEVEAIIDYAIEDGEFVEKRGALRRP
ncbi:hypothetical protein HYG81_10330 [Natrinema zhouii]|uniref:Uncharacterized protein n=1 Tax=Natrinema zhouii TaxID=1710539 RepID=A0A7D6GNS1_9EURY|nr:hypothetical protein [Natrinema zhouii]QLK24522.1 hypothetical protein HYG81_10330 [Natrinema zhouii]